MFHTTNKIQFKKKLEETNTKSKTGYIEKGANDRDVESIFVIKIGQLFKHKFLSLK
jgi:hypothetical protein